MRASARFNVLELQSRKNEESFFFLAEVASGAGLFFSEMNTMTLTRMGDSDSHSVS